LLKDFAHAIFATAAAGRHPEFDLEFFNRTRARFDTLADTLV
jgi:hypothetical protein